jgi:predicted secreted protein
MNINQLPEECQADDEELSITLKENPTTGYTWKCSMDRIGILELESDEYKGEDISETLIGAGGEHSWYFKGISKGHVAVDFLYYRPWEGENSATDRKSYTIHVGENGKIESVI